MIRPPTVSSKGPHWYRQFWPWFLIALPGTVVIASLYTLFLANQYADDLVVDDYYKEGLAINRELKRQESALERGISAQINASGRQLDITVTGAIEAEQLRLRLSHPMEAARDFSVPIHQIGSGHYRVMLPQPLNSRWHWIIDAGDGSPWRVDGDQHF